MLGGASDQVDVAIVGAGPTGLYAAYYAGFRGLDVAIVDALPVVGGQVSAMYPEKVIADVAGFPAVSGAELIARLEEQVQPFAPTFHLGQRVERMTSRSGAVDGAAGLDLHTDARTVIGARTVIVAGGVGHFSPRRLPTAAGLRAEDVDSFVTSLDPYVDQDIVIVGGGDSALDWALMLSPVAGSVTVVHRRDRFRAHAHSVSLAQKQGVRLLTRAQVVGSVYDHELEAVLVEHADGSRTTEPCGRVVAALGFTARLGPILEWDLGIERQRHIPVGSRMHTNRERVFAAGDITTYDGKVPLISVGFGEAATAVSNACRVIHPEAPLFGGHSTETTTPVARSVAVGEVA
ncbi:NAD(P)/FAD-dependent oxidoreductase [Nocardioides sp. AE5]|uniref:NAD(P)/FAD-dependent oxidoreductase n=1 Tax=Nocardioides sp. AE5 TaxID=2962573 RepID=UPI0028810D98|nr:NAD(P)/FAD-dependent oxidoreductase [Nocardioides sp. AE5]MDT0202612.1 NAD(P)/FAD-dependent oxidoreductase [Nocardioides sp. AE5]